MGAIARGNTPATDVIVDRIRAMIEADEFDLPNDLVFLAADLPDFGVIMRNALESGKPILVVYPDGRERLIPAAKARRPQS